MEQNIERLKVLQRQREYEIKGWFDRDVEDDPPTITLMPDKVDYLNKKLSSKIKTKIANHMGTSFFEKLIKKGDIIIDEVKGLENLDSVKSGAVLTCNHFNPCDNYVLYRSILKWLNKRPLYKVIREGNFTSFPGLYGFLFRHCNTLPLSSNMETMRLFMSAVKTLLDRGDRVLVFAEQGMWWNYRKPRPLKSGAFRFAVKSNVPVIPCFIAMKDSDKLDNDGFYIQRYTINIMPAIYPKKELSVLENQEYLKTENERVWKEVYEEFYGEPLTYLTKEEE